MSKIAFIGGGNMSSCIFDGIIKTRGFSDEIIVSGPHLEKLEEFAAKKATITTSNLEACQKSEVIFLGVKPQMLTSVLEELASAKLDFSNRLVISMVAGFRFSALERLLSSSRIVRIMPNTPSKLGLGVTGICFGNVSEDDKTLTHDLLKGLGTLIDFKEEESINVIGAVGGSAPAFLYRFLEALIAESVKLGMSEDQARKVIEQMALGTASMVIACQDQKLSELREAVTSKGGTTFEGLKVMSEYKFEEMMAKTIEASMNRTHEFERMFK